MGNLCGGSSAEARNNAAIDRQMAKDEEEYQRKLKLLLLGAGESGKSTLFKQMRLLYTEQKQFKPAEKSVYRQALYRNIFTDFSTLIASCEEFYPLVNSEAKVAASTLAKQISESKEKSKSKKEITLTLDSNLAELLSKIWKDAEFQQMWENRGVLQVQDSLEYFMIKDNLARISQKNYTPSNMDILRTRVRTTGIVQEPFVIQGATLELYDVGGQLNERRKWIDAFAGVTGVIFVAAISEYNQVMFENATKQRQDDAVELFAQQLGLDIWKNTPFILFLNKTDLFKEKLVKIPFRVDTPGEERNINFQGPHCDIGRDYRTDGSDKEFNECYTAACNFLQGLYESQSSPGREDGIYTKFTNSTDTEQMSHIMNSCKDIILRGNLINGGWINSQ